jgi:signal transduction histidine kinase
MRVAVGIMFALAALCTPVLRTSAFAQVVSSKTVLTIHEGAEYFPVNPLLEAGIHETLKSRSDLPVDYFAEYLESDEFPQGEASRAFEDYIRRKYQGRRIDLAIATTSAGLRFVLDHRAEVCPDAPIVFASIDVPDDSVLRAGAGAAGIRLGVNQAETLKLALTLHPSTERVFYVSNPLDLAEPLRAQLRDIGRQVTLTFVYEPPLSRLLAVIKDAPPRSLIVYRAFRQDVAGQRMYPDEVAPLVAGAARVPVYGTNDMYIGSGVVGGVVRDSREVGRRLGAIALRILAGTRAQDIPVEDVAAVPTFDWRAMQRWGISESRLPPGSVVRFREPSLWRDYRRQVLAVLGALVVQTLLIGALLVQRRNRRRVEAALRVSEEKARASYDQVRDLAGRLISAREDERTRIARDLHDDIGQRVASLSIALSRLQREVPEAPSPAKQSLSTLEQQTMQLSADLRHLSHELHPGELEHLGLLEALRERCDAFSEESGVPVRFDVSEEWREAPAALALCLYRVAQEALRNVATHARARNVTVSLDQCDGHLKMQVTDDGCGFDPTATTRRSGLGLVSLAERVRMLGGELAVSDAPDAGTRLAVSLPIPESHAS